MNTAKFFNALAMLSVAAAMLVSPVALGAPTPAGPDGGSLTDGLNDLLKGLPPAEPAEPAEERPATEQPSSRGPVGEDLGQPEASPLVRIERGMTESSRLIPRKRIDAETARIQQQVIRDLDDLIRRAEQQQKQQQQQSGQSQPNQPDERQASQRSESQPQPGQQAGQQQKPGQRDANGQQQAGRQQAGQQTPSSQDANQSTERTRVGAADPVAGGRTTSELMKEVWGSLPPRLREQMLEASSDEFLPEYRDAIEQYYRRLAEQPEGSDRSN